MSISLRYLALGAVLAATGTLAKDVTEDNSMPAFLDDRSTAHGVVQSYYNAIALGQYSRAFSYTMRGTPQETPDQLSHAYKAFRKNYEQTASIKIRMGKGFTSAGEELEMTAVPVVFETLSDTGERLLQASCHYVVQQSPTAQDYVPYDPIRIDHTTMEITKDDFHSQSMPDCRF